jgi:hypothetical protein
MRSAPAKQTTKLEDIPTYTHANPTMHRHSHTQPHTQWPDFQCQETPTENEAPTEAKARSENEAPTEAKARSENEAPTEAKAHEAKARSEAQGATQVSQDISHSLSS